ncbi:MAG: ribosome maturation factor RimP [Desulfatiglandales bacterium]
MSEAKRVINEVSDLAEGLLTEYGMEMVDVEFRFEGGRWTLRIFIDKEGGVTVDDCASVNRELGDLIEAKNIIDYHYVLEISSPGLNRPLKKESDFIRSIGKMVTLRMSRPINKRKNFTGRLTNVREGIISLLVDEDNLVELPLEEIDRARLKYEFSN